jgi:hypothetical protein
MPALCTEDDEEVLAPDVSNDDAREQGWENSLLKKQMHVVYVS